jgi:hypothetical protein
LQVKAGLILLKGVALASDKKDSAAKSVTLWQSVYDKNINAGTTTLYDVKARLDNGMKLPVPKSVLRVIAIKQEK